MVFKEVEDAGDAYVLLLLGGAEAGTVHVNVQAAGAALVADIAQVCRRGQNRLPGHVVFVEGIGHGVGDDLEAAVQGTVVFAVDKLVRSIGQVQHRLGVGTVLPAPVDLQLHAEVAAAVPVEDGIRLVAVVVDEIGLRAGITFPAQRRVIVVVHIIGVAEPDEPAAAVAVGVIAVVAAATQGGVGIPLVVVAPDSLPAGGADKSVLLQTGFTEDLVVQHGIMVFVDGCTAECTGQAAFMIFV